MNQPPPPDRPPLDIKIGENWYTYAELLTRWQERLPARVALDKSPLKWVWAAVSLFLLASVALGWLIFPMLLGDIGTWLWLASLPLLIILAFATERIDVLLLRRRLRRSELREQ